MTQKSGETPALARHNARHNAFHNLRAPMQQTLGHYADKSVTGNESAVNNFSDENIRKILVRPKVGYGHRNPVTGRIVDGTVTPFILTKSKENNKHRVLTPYPSNISDAQSNLTHGVTNIQVTPFVNNQQGAIHSSSSEKQSSNARPRNLSKDFNKQRINISGLVSNKGCGFRSDCNVNIHSSAPQLSLNPTASARKNVNRSVNLRYSSSKPANINNSMGLRQSIGEKLDEPKYCVTEISDCWNYEKERPEDESKQLEDLETTLKMKADENSILRYANLDLDLVNPYTDSSTSQNYNNKNNQDTIPSLYKTHTTKELRQLKFEEKHGMKYQSFNLPTIKRWDSYHDLKKNGDTILKKITRDPTNVNNSTDSFIKTEVGANNHFNYKTAINNECCQETGEKVYKTVETNSKHNLNSHDSDLITSPVSDGLLDTYCHKQEILVDNADVVYDINYGSDVGENNLEHLPQLCDVKCGNSGKFVSSLKRIINKIKEFTKRKDKFNPRNQTELLPDDGIGSSIATIESKN